MLLPGYVLQGLHYTLRRPATLLISLHRLQTHMICMAYGRRRWRPSPFATLRRSLAPSQRCLSTFCPSGQAIRPQMSQRRRRSFSPRSIVINHPLSGDLPPRFIRHPGIAPQIHLCTSHDSAVSPDLAACTFPEPGWFVVAWLTRGVLAMPIREDPIAMWRGKRCRMINDAIWYVAVTTWAQAR